MSALLFRYKWLFLRQFDSFSSGVWDEVYLRYPVVVPLVLLLVESVKMLRERLCHNCLNDWLARLWTPTQLEWLVQLLVGGLKLELMRLVVRDTEL